MNKSDADYYWNISMQAMCNPDDVEITGINEFGFPILYSKKENVSTEIVIFNIGKDENTYLTPRRGPGLDKRK